MGAGLSPTVAAAAGGKGGGAGELLSGASARAPEVKVRRMRKRAGKRKTMAASPRSDLNLKFIFKIKDKTRRRARR
jgi:hypothetical protein